ncbi:hypothetical protein ACU4HD_44485 (plasmid) [Cupriavidus basilensis]
MLSKLENGKGVNLEHALRALEGLGLAMLVVPKAHAALLEQAATHAAKASQLAMRADGIHMEEGDPSTFERSRWRKSNTPAAGAPTAIIWPWRRSRAWIGGSFPPLRVVLSGGQSEASFTNTLQR